LQLKTTFKVKGKIELKAVFYMALFFLQRLVSLREVPQAVEKDSSRIINVVTFIKVNIRGTKLKI